MDCGRAPAAADDESISVIRRLYLIQTYVWSAARFENDGVSLQFRVMARRQPVCLFYFEQEASLLVSVLSFIHYYILTEVM